MSENEHRDWPRYFHVAPILLGEGSIIEPGNWGRILKLYRGNAVNSVLGREYVLEQIRASEFPDKPSRLNCIFLLRTLREAVRYRDSESHLGLIYEVAVNTANAEVHFGDYDFGGAVSVIQFLEGMPEVARKYWTEQPTNTVEILFPGPAVVVARH
ncbi:DUF2441 domain-containing protein [Pseudomonas sp. SCA2728.1_7]|uniref:DUF2441 domain-containing protein n=1 Tax=Pseudomonas sp. SCA2728.1_7 TaxID=2825975 RepID=UPI001BAFC3A0|nr:DUF2441 domain-containing protein [Pseudomonas sp. SCA2728.1_7]QUE90452.1 DUF2441 domain-containing protein [Pseudomonas sp. SCA2728.1_7]